MFLLQCCAVAFIEKLDAQSLNLSQEDFERYMSGAASSLGPKATSSSASSQSGTTVPPPDQRKDLPLGARQERRAEETQALEADLIEWREGQELSVLGILEAAPVRTHASATLTIDSDNIGGDSLPPPLQPQKFAS